MNRLLIIEDNKQEADNLVELVARPLEVETRIAVNMTEGLVLIETWHPDAVLLDLGLPDSPPEITIGQIPRIASLCHALVILTGNSGLDADAMRIRCITLGARSFVQKDHILGSGWRLLAGLLRDAGIAQKAERRKTQPLRP